MAKKIEVVSDFKKVSTPPKVKLSIEGSDILVHSEDGEENILGRLEPNGTVTLFVLTNIFGRILEIEKGGTIEVNRER